ncbi:MAG: MFS transporter [Rhodospirillaceae bacterium]|nr:MFS transporter [Rhodospirillaceae bacterium]
METSAETDRSGNSNNKAVISWCLFDWANSPFPTLILTFLFSTYFIKAVAENEIQGTFLWSQAVGVSSFIIAVTAPALGAIADQAGRRKTWVLVFSTASILATLGLWFATPETSSIPLTLICVSIGIIGFELSTVFYNATLFQIAHPTILGRISGLGWGAGYLGAIVCLIICLFTLIRADPDLLGLDTDKAEHLRATALVVALWWIIFSVPFFIYVDQKGSPRASITQAVSNGLTSLLQTVKTLRHYPSVLLFLLARMLYADGLLVVFQFGGLYAAGTFGMSFDDILKFGIAMNISAGVGAFFFAWWDDKIGSKLTIIIALTGLLTFGSAILFIETTGLFWLFSMGMSFFIGPAQSSSRALLARLSPSSMHGQMYGLFALSGKATSFAGPIIFGWLVLFFESQRAGMAVAVCFWLFGLLVLLWVREDEGFSQG